MAESSNRLSTLAFEGEDYETINSQLNRSFSISEDNDFDPFKVVTEDVFGKRLSQFYAIEAPD